MLFLYQSISFSLSFFHDFLFQSISFFLSLSFSHAFSLSIYFFLSLSFVSFFKIYFFFFFLSHIKLSQKVFLLLCVSLLKAAAFIGKLLFIVLTCLICIGLWVCLRLSLSLYPSTFVLFHIISMSFFVFNVFSHSLCINECISKFTILLYV